MDNEIEPTVGNWYQDLINGRVFQVVAMDEDEAQVELQHSDGDIEELSLDEWHSMDVESTEAPDDWIGPLDDVERDNLDFASTRSEAESRGRAQSRRSEALQTDDNPEDAGIMERYPADEAGAPEIVEGSVRQARDRLSRRREDYE
jgi:hypothetical protein